MKKKSYQTLSSLIFTLLVISSLIFTGCIDVKPEEKISFEYSFEQDMQGWKPDGTDLSDPPINWSIEPSDHIAYDGIQSLKLYLNNLNDAGKIWVEKSFDMEPNTHYQIHLSYQFCTQDFGNVNLFKIIAGATTANPETVDDLIFQDDTGHHQDQDIGYTWVNKSYLFTVQTNDSGVVYLMIGIWGTWETARTYFVDTVNISFSTIPTYSFPNLTGSWMISYFDWEGNMTDTEIVSIIQQNETIKISRDTENLISSIMVKNNLASPHNITDYVIIDCDFRGLGIDYIYVYNDSYLKTNLPLCENCQPAVFTRVG